MPQIAHGEPLGIRDGLYFKQLGRANRVLAVMMEGEPNVNRDANKQALGFSAKQECFPKAMRPQMASDGSRHNKAPFGRITEGCLFVQKFTNICSPRKQ
jgi:hypothetical protein